MAAAIGRVFTSFSSLAGSLFSKASPTSLQQLHRVYNPNSGGVGAMLASPWQQDAQVRCKWANRWMRRDAKRRVLIAERYDDRLHAAIIYRNRTLPPELREIGRLQLKDMGLRSSILYKNNRCAVTGRARGGLRRWRVSRFVFRHMADYNMLPGVTRAMW